MSTIDRIDPDAEQQQAPAADSLRAVGPSYSLRYAMPDDAECLLELASDPAVTRFFSWGPYKSIQEPLAYIDSLTEKREKGSLLEFVIVGNDDDQPVGVTGLTEISLRDRRAVVGSWLGHRYWGSGVNRESKALVLAVGFKGIELNRISAYSHVRNGRSAQALDRIGFRPEGVLNAWHYHRGEPQDVQMHCMLRDVYLRTELAEISVQVTGEIPAPFRLPAL